MPILIASRIHYYFIGVLTDHDINLVYDYDACSTAENGTSKSRVGSLETRKKPRQACPLLYDSTSVYMR
jgi:hypothetical protein